MPGMKEMKPGTLSPNSLDHDRPLIAWVNSKLNPSSSIATLDDDRIKNGMTFAELLTTLSGKRIAIQVPCVTRYDRMTNIIELLNTLQQIHVPLQNIRAKDIADGNRDAVTRLLLTMSAFFMPTYIHDVRHEVQERIATNRPTQKPGLNYKKVHYTRLPEHTIHSIVDQSRCMRNPRHQLHSLHVHKVFSINQSSGINESMQNIPVASIPNSLSNSSAYMYRRSPSLNANDAFRQAHFTTRTIPISPSFDKLPTKQQPTFNNQKSTAERRSCDDLYRFQSQENSVITKPILSTNQIGPRNFVTKLFIPNLRQSEPKTSHKSSHLPIQEAISLPCSTNTNGYINHGFVDAITRQQNLLPEAAIHVTAFHKNLQDVRTDLLQLQNLLTDDNSSDSQSLKNTNTENQNNSVVTNKGSKLPSNNLLIENTELREVVNKLTEELKHLYNENSRLKLFAGIQKNTSVDVIQTSCGLDFPLNFDSLPSTKIDHL